MNSFFTELFEYSHYFNQKLIGILIENKDKAPERSIQLINHTINAHQVWNSRILREQSFGVWDMHAIAELPELDTTNYLKTISILNSTPLSQIIDYANSKGDRFSNSVRDILFHVVNHSTYHRGQVTMQCKQNGIDPIISDYIFYKR